MTPLRYIKNFAAIAAWDFLQNRLYCKGAERFLIVRHPGEKPMFYQTYLDWLAIHFPRLRAHFELHLLPVSLRRKGNYVLHIPWLQDPVENWSTTAHFQATSLMKQCDHLRIPVINRVNRLTNAAKSSAPGLITAAVPDFRVPKTVRITDPVSFYDNAMDLPLPILVREDYGHQNPILRIDAANELRSATIQHMKRPVASEIIDVRSPDGLFRKYRYVVAGEIGVPLSMHLCQTWIARGSCALYNEQMHSEEKEYTRTTCSHHGSFVKAARALSLDLVAFDYSLDKNGVPVIWEANPYPFFHFPSGEFRQVYGGAATARVFAAMTTLYLLKAGIRPPRALEAALEL